MKRLLLLLIVVCSMIGAYGQKIEDLPRAAAVAATDLVIIDQADATRAVTVATLMLGPPFPWVALFPDGTTGAPGASFWNDLDVGMWRPGDDIIAFSAGAVEGFRITEAAGAVVNTFTDDVIITDLASANTVVLSPTATGQIDTLETTDLATADITVTGDWVFDNITVDTITGENDETIDNGTDGTWDFGAATLKTARTTTANSYTNDITTEWTSGAAMASGGSNGIYSIANPIDTLQNAYSLRGRMDLRDADDDVYVNQLHAVDALINLSDIDTVDYFVDDNMSVFGGAIHGGVSGSTIDGTGTGSLGGATLNVIFGMWGPTAEQDYDVETNFIKMISHAGTTVDYGLNIESSSDMDAGILLNSHTSNSPATMDVGLEMISAADKMVYGIDMNAASMTTADIRFQNAATIDNIETDTLALTETVTKVEGELAVTGQADIGGLLEVTGTITGGTLVCLHTVAAVIFSDLDSCKNVAHFNNDADVIDFTLPGAEAGLVVMFYDIGGGVITIDPVDGEDTIYLNGTSVGAGDAIDSPGAVGDFICLMAIDATRWITVGRSGVWIDGGAD